MFKTNLAVLAFLTLLLVSCSKDETPVTTGNSNGTGTLVIRMTDRPAAYDSIMIQVDSVRAHISSSDTTSGWVTLNRTPAMYNLLALVNGADTVIGQASLPPGVYSQIRLFIGGGSHVVVGGVSHPLTIPSGSQSGLKLNVHAPVLENITYVILLDFDAARSIHVTGNGRYMLKPVIRAVATAQTGIISGRVQPSSTRAAVTAVAGTDTVGTLADTSGAFKLVYLQPATYSVSIVPTDTTYRDTTITGVGVTAGATTSLGTITLQPR